MEAGRAVQRGLVTPGPHDADRLDPPGLVDHREDGARRRPRRRRGAARGIARGAAARLVAFDMAQLADDTGSVDQRRALRRARRQRRAAVRTRRRSRRRSRAAASASTASRRAFDAGFAGALGRGETTRPALARRASPTGPARRAVGGDRVGPRPRPRRRRHRGRATRRSAALVERARSSFPRRGAGDRRRRAAPDDRLAGRRVRRLYLDRLDRVRAAAPGAPRARRRDRAPPRALDDLRGHGPRRRAEDAGDALRARARRGARRATARCWRSTSTCIRACRRSARRCRPASAAGSSVRARPRRLVERLDGEGQGRDDAARSRASCCSTSIAGLRRFRRSEPALRRRERAHRGVARPRSSASPRSTRRSPIEVAQCQRLVKGYGDTHARGWRNFAPADGRRRPRRRGAARRRRSPGCAKRRWPTSTATALAAALAAARAGERREAAAAATDGERAEPPTASRRERSLPRPPRRDPRPGRARPRPPRSLHRRGAVRARAGALLRQHLELRRPREPARRTPGDYLTVDDRRPAADRGARTTTAACAC